LLPVPNDLLVGSPVRENQMQHASYRQSHDNRGQRQSGSRISGFEKFAVRFAEVALLAGIIGAGIALLLVQTG
jgi:hypothetical protein